MIPEPTGTTAVATNAWYAKLFAELGADSLAVGIVLLGSINSQLMRIIENGKITKSSSKK